MPFQDNSHIREGGKCLEILSLIFRLTIFTFLCRSNAFSCVYFNQSISIQTTKTGSSFISFCQPIFLGSYEYLRRLVSSWLGSVSSNLVTESTRLQDFLLLSLVLQSRLASSMLQDLGKKRVEKLKKNTPTSLVFSRHLSSLTLRGSTSQERSPSWHHCSQGFWLLAGISIVKK